MAESDDLTLIPRALRDKLDRAGIKLHLREWQLFTLAERQRLVARRCDTAADIEALRADLTALVRAYTGREPDRLPG